MDDKQPRVYTSCPDTIGGRRAVDWNIPQPQLVSLFETVLESAKDEKPMQLFVEENPVALLTGLVRPHQAWVIPRPSLPKSDGSGWVPDFIVCEWSSTGHTGSSLNLKARRRARSH